MTASRRTPGKFHTLTVGHRGAILSAIRKALKARHMVICQKEENTSI